MTLPVFETARLVLRQRTMADLEPSLAMDREPGTTDLIPGPWDDPAKHRAFTEARIRGPFPEGLGYWVVARREHPEEFLGWVLLIPEDAVGPEVEIGWRMTHASRGHGYAPEAATPLIAHGLGTLGLPRIIADIHRDNAASLRVAEKIGLMRAADGPAGWRDAIRHEARLDCAGAPRAF